MKLPILNAEKNKQGERILPSQFSEEYRPDLIWRAVLALQSAARQRHGSDPEAGKKYSSKTSKRRRKYRGTYGFGISRVQRKILSRRGTRFIWVGATSPQTVGGRRAHPPKAGKILKQKVNIKENRKAIRSAMSATFDKKIVQKRGHKVPVEYPFIISGEMEKMSKAQDIQEALSKLGFDAEMERSMIKKVRSGIGKLRGRKYQRKKGILLVVSEKCPLMKAAANIPGMDVVEVKALNVELLAPGSLPGRISLWTEKAVNVLEKGKLFV